jgi:hypothetical protein
MWKKMATAVGLSVAPLAGLMAKPAEASRAPQTVCFGESGCNGTTFWEHNVCYEWGVEVANYYVEVDNAPECGGDYEWC